VPFEEIDCVLVRIIAGKPGVRGTVEYKVICNRWCEGALTAAAPIFSVFDVDVYGNVDSVLKEGEYGEFTDAVCRTVWNTPEEWKYFYHKK
jgi:hypothetical protein